MFLLCMFLFMPHSVKGLGMNKFESSKYTNQINKNGMLSHTMNKIMDSSNVFCLLHLVDSSSSIDHNHEDHLPVPLLVINIEDVR